MKDRPAGPAARPTGAMGRSPSIVAQFSRSSRNGVSRSGPGSRGRPRARSPRVLRWDLVGAAAQAHAPAVEDVVSEVVVLDVALDTRPVAIQLRDPRPGTRGRPSGRPGRRRPGPGGSATACRSMGACPGRAPSQATIRSPAWSLASSWRTTGSSRRPRSLGPGRSAGAREWGSGRPSIAGSAAPLIDAGPGLDPLVGQEGHRGGPAPVDLADHRRTV